MPGLKNDAFDLAKRRRVPGCGFDSDPCHWIDGLKQPEPEAPEIQVNPKSAMKANKRQADIDRMGAALSRSMVIDRMGKALAESQAKEAEQEQANKVETNDNTT